MKTTGLASAKLKLARAAKHIKSLKRSIAEYAASRPYKITGAKTQGNAKKLTIPREPPRDISILAGEALYQMRSALDHLAFELVKSNPMRISLLADWGERCEFPLFRSLPRKGNPPVALKTPIPYNVLAKNLPGISKEAYAFIESVQPYHRKTAINTALAFLARLSNIDKHRHLNVVYPRVRESHAIRFASGLSSRGHQALDRGAKLPPETGWTESDRPVYMRRCFRAFVAFKERSLEGAATLPADYLLELILKELQAVIIPAFEKLI